MADLLFDRIAASNGDLIFGETEGELPSISVPATADLVLPGPAIDVHVSIAFPVGFAFTLAGPTVAIAAKYVSGATRPTVGKTTAGWQAGAQRETGREMHHQAAVKLQGGVDAPWQAARTTEILAAIVAQQALPARALTATAYEQGVPAATRTGLRHQEARFQRTLVGGRWQEAVPASDDLAFRYQEALRDRRNRTAARWQEALRHTLRSYTGQISDGQPVVVGRVLRYQEAWPPRPGRSINPIIVPPKEPCYTPSAHLVFSKVWDGSRNLLFVCDGHEDDVAPPDATVIVPIKRVYVLLNSASLRRIEGNVMIPTLSMSLSLDCDSWTWSFSASLPLQAQTSLLSDDPVEVEALVNNVPYRFLVESLSRERTFNDVTLRATGRGLAAVLDAPYAPTMSFGNAEARTAQQLVADVLTINGVPMDWDIEWGLDDWNVPAGVFSHEGSYIDALNTIAKAAGGYIQPVPVEQGLRVLHRYPVGPWDWNTVTPDFEIPSAVMRRESIDWVKKPQANRIFVSGTAGGVLGRYTRAGTAGDVLLPTVTDPLITAADAVRQRGRAEIAAGGNSAMVGLGLPVLEETGIIPPGKWVRYTDGGITKFGITRSVRVDVGLPEVWQSIEVETRV